MHIRNLTLLIFSLLLSTLVVAEEVWSTEKITKIYEREHRSNTEAMEIFWALRDKYGERLRTVGALVTCGESNLADKIQPNIVEMFLFGSEFLSKSNPSKYDPKNKAAASGAALIRRALTATTAYSYASDEANQYFIKMHPEGKVGHCKSIVKNANKLLSSLPDSN